MKQKITEISTAELIAGYQKQDSLFKCVICDESFQEGYIYNAGDDLVDAQKAIELHVQNDHGGMLKILLDMPPEKSGITEIQKKILTLLASGKSDREIARSLGGKAESTIRNHRFQFKKRVQEAKILLAVSELLNRLADVKMEFIKFHDNIPMADERIMTTQKEAEKILGRVFKPGSQLKLIRFPKKEKEKLVVLKRITEEFQPGKTYSEKQVNGILEPIFSDYATIRRYLIEYKFLSRNRDCSEYNKC